MFMYAYLYICIHCSAYKYDCVYVIKQSIYIALLHLLPLKKHLLHGYSTDIKKCNLK